MKLKTNPRHISLLGGLLAASTFTTHAATLLEQGHTDIGAAYDVGSDTWDLHVHDEFNDIEYAPEDAVLVVKPLSLGSVPAGAQWNFLGSAGSDIWTLPQAENPSLLFLGLAAEEIGIGIFVGDTVRMTLKSISGPGEFSAYLTDSFGEPSTVAFNTRDGVNSSDRFDVPTGGHQDFNWAFSAAGTYTLNFEASGTLVAGNTPVASGNIPYTFEVQPVPEPGTIALLTIGAAGAFMLRRRR